MQKVLARLALYRRLLSVLVSASLLLMAVITAYALLVSRAPRAVANQPQPVAPVASTIAVPVEPTSPAATPAVTPAPAPAAPVAPPPPAARWPEKVTGRVVDAQKQPLAGV